MMNFLKKAYGFIKGVLMSKEAKKVKEMYEFMLDSEPHPGAAQEWTDMRNAVNNLANRVMELELQMENVTGRLGGLEAPIPTRFRELTDGGEDGK